VPIPAPARNKFRNDPDAKKMSDQTLVWLILAGVVALAGLLLWFRDRVRDLHHIPEAERKHAERRSIEAASGFVSFLVTVMCLIHGFEIPTFSPRIYYLLGAFLFAWFCIRSFRRYQTVRAGTRASKHLANQDGGAT
jgi:hypothetical protein